MNAHRIRWMNFLLAGVLLLWTRVDSLGQTITTVAGGGTGDGGPATHAGLFWPAEVSVDRAGHVYIADTRNHRIRRVDEATGLITTVAGMGISDFSGDGGPATEASLSQPSGVSVDGAGHLFIADSGNHRIRRVDRATGIITTVAGMGEEEGSFSGDGGPATQAGLNNPVGVSVDAAGNVYIADAANLRIRRIDAATGIITTVAGTGEGGYSGDGGHSTEAGLTPRRVFVDMAGNLYIADTFNHRIRRVDGDTGIITTVAGTGEEGFSGDGGPATQARIGYPGGLSVDGAGNLYIAADGRIRRVDGDTGVITTTAGTGEEGHLGDGGPATQAGLSFSSGVSVDGAGYIYIADTSNHRIRRMDGATGIITTVAGTGEQGFSGDGGPATMAGLNFPSGVSVVLAGHIYIADTSNHRIRRVDGATGIITTVAGTGESFDPFSDEGDPAMGDGGPATEANLSGPSGVSVDGAGHLYIADTGSSRIRRVDAASGIITTVAGTGEGADVIVKATQNRDLTGDGGPATQATLIWPKGVFVDGVGHLFIADTFNHRIRRVDAETGIITTAAGTGEEGFSGDGDSATEADLAMPEGVYVDEASTLYIADTANNRIRRVDAETGIISTAAGTDERGFSGDGGPATQASLNFPSGVSVDGAGHLYVADTRNGRIRKVTFTPTVVADSMEPDQTPTAFALAQNYPNPFNPHTRIGYQLAEAGPVSLTIYNLLGQRIRVLVEQPQAAGSYEVLWDSKDAGSREVVSGMYMYRLASRQGVLARRMLRLK